MSVKNRERIFLRDGGNPTSPISATNEQVEDEYNEDCSSSSDDDEKHNDDITPSDTFSTTSYIDLGLFNSLQMMERRDKEVATDSSTHMQVTDGFTSEMKRQTFHCYLKDSGLLGAIAKSLLALYDQQKFPPVHQAGEFIANILGYSLTIRDDIAKAKNNNSNLLDQIQNAKIENDWLRRRLDEFESSETPIEILPDPALITDEEEKLPVKLKRRPHKSKLGLTKMESTNKEDDKEMKDAIHKLNQMDTDNFKYLNEFQTQLTKEN